MGKVKGIGTLLLAFVFIIIIAVASVTIAEEASKKSIELSSIELAVASGKTAKLIASVENEKAKFTWESTDENIAVVNKSGAVTGKNNGSTFIICSTDLADGTHLSAECTVTVYTPVKTIVATKTPGGKQTFVNVGQESDPFEIEISPDNASCTTVTWSSTDESIAIVDPTGRVTGKKAGKVSIIATSDDPYSGGKPKTCVFKISVNQGVEKLTITGDSKVQKGKSLKLTCNVYPEDATNKKIVWSSSNEKVAKVANGTVSAIGTGKCTIKATTTDGTNCESTHEIEIVQYVTQLKSNTRGVVAITNGKKKTINLSVLPKDATNRKLAWTSSRPSIAEVDQYGSVTAKSTGECTITAKTTDGSGKQIEFKICVEPKNPFVIDAIERYYYYNNDVNCIQIIGHSIAKSRIIKSFSFNIVTLDNNDNILGSAGCQEQSCNVRPGGIYRMGSYYWSNIPYIISAAKAIIAIKQLTYSDGTTETLSESDIYDNAIVFTFR